MVRQTQRLKRRLDWPERLAEFIARCRGRKFDADYYCALFAADAILAMTENDPAAAVRGMDVEAAAAWLRGQGYETLLDYLRHEFHEVPLAMAGRGDVILRDLDGREALGICLGVESAFLSSAGGLALWPTLDQQAAFRV